MTNQPTRIFIVSVVIVVVFFLTSFSDALITKKESILAGFCSSDTYSKSAAVPGKTTYSVGKGLLHLVNHFPHSKGSPCKIYSQAGSTLVVAYRGSDTVNDWVNNINTIYESATLGPYSTYVGKVHSGFLNSYKQTRYNVMSELNDLVKSGKYSRVLFAGHSQGGAVAVLAALEFSMKHPSWRHKIGLITFGQPRVGNSVFTASLNAHVVDFVRFVNVFQPKLLGLPISQKEDLVCTVPPKTFGYVHAGTKVDLDCTASTRIACHDMGEYKMGMNVYFAGKNGDATIPK